MSELPFVNVYVYVLYDLYYHKIDSWPASGEKSEKS